MIQPFSFSTVSQMHFGAGKISMLPSLIRTFGTKILLVTGARSFLSSPEGINTLTQLDANGIVVEHYRIDSEPTPAMIDIAVEKFSIDKPQVVVAVGGGSVLDAGKAIAAMLLLNEPVKHYLEGIGTKKHPGKKIPFIAIPTTSGTGSEATKNAVLSEVGENGYKKSLRHNNFIPDAVIIDPVLTVSCSKAVTAASGLDAFTQLLESYLSTAASPMTDALALEGLRHVAQSLKQAYTDGTNISARTSMALASHLSGITLANAGLGVVHGFASAIGGYTQISHGVICSTLIHAANSVTIQKLRTTKSNADALHKYAVVGEIFSDHKLKSQDYYIDTLLDCVKQWTHEMKIPLLSLAGITSAHFEKVVRATENKNNPIALDKRELMEVLELAAGSVNL